MKGLAADISCFRLTVGLSICALFFFAVRDGPTQQASGMPLASSAIPVLVMRTDGQAVVDRARVRARIDAFSQHRTSEADEVRIEYSGRAELSIRGNTSYYFQKKSYRLELQNESANDTKAPLLGMPPDSDWVLYASVTDRTFARNLLAHELWRRMGRYAVRCRYVELFVITNGWPTATSEEIRKQIPRVLDVLPITHASAAGLTFSNMQNTTASILAESYMGFYVLMEKIKRGKERVNIAKLRRGDSREPEISGGYIIKKDDQGRNERGLLTGQEVGLRFEDPKESKLTAEQKGWMANYLGDCEKALFGRNFRDADNGYGKYIDVDSFVDFHWLVEVSQNADGFWFSQYMHKDRGGKLTMGPVWDWDNAFGNPFFSESRRTNGWRFESAQDPDYTWYRRLFEDPDFLQRYVDRWSELRTNILATSNVLAVVDGIVSQLKGAQRRNTARWELEGRHASLRARVGVSLEDEVKLLKDWITGRLSWIDSQEFPKPVAQFETESESTEPKVVLTCVVGRVFYTTDGSDPRARGGSVAPTSTAYSVPIAAPPQSVITARVRSEFGLWSAPVKVQAPFVTQ